MSELLNKFFGPALGDNGERLFSTSTDFIWKDIDIDKIKNESNVPGYSLEDALNEIKCLKDIQIVQQPQSKTINEGDSTVFTVAVANPSTETYQWYLNGSVIGSNSNSLTIPTSLAVGNYNVNVEVSNGCSKNVSSNTVNLSVNANGGGGGSPGGGGGSPGGGGASPFTITETTKLFADGSINDFGSALAIDGNIVVAGVDNDSSPGSNQGAVYVYDITNPSNPTRIRKLVASDGASFDKFGCSVAIDGNKIIVGAKDVAVNGTTDAGAAYVYDLTSPATEIKITAGSDVGTFDEFGYAVEITGDKAIVSTEDTEFLYVYDITSANPMNSMIKISSSNGEAGLSLASQNNKLIVGHPDDNVNGADSGSVSVLGITSPTSPSRNSIVVSDNASNDEFGNSVAISGDNIIAGAFRKESNGNESGAAYVYNLINSQEIKLVSSNISEFDKFGSSVGISGNKVIVGAPFDDAKSQNAGAAYVYDITDPANTETQILGSGVGALDNFSHRVAISGNKAAVMGDNQTALYIYTIS